MVFWLFKNLRFHHKVIHILILSFLVRKPTSSSTKKTPTVSISTHINRTNQTIYSSSPKLLAYCVTGRITAAMEARMNALTANPSIRSSLLLVYFIIQQPFYLANLIVVSICDVLRTSELFKHCRILLTPSRYLCV